MLSTVVLQVLCLAAAPAPDVAPEPATTTSQPIPAALRPASRDEAILVGAGDIADCQSPGDEATATVVERFLAASDNAVAFTAGDNVYPDGTPDQYRRCYEPTWGRFKSRTLPAVGNHDARTKNSAGMRATFAGRFSQDGPLWYAADVKGVDGAGLPVAWRVVVLDSNCDQVDCTEKGPQYAWLKEELRKQKAAKQACTLVIAHHPRFSSGPHGDAVVMAPMWRLLDDGGADLVVNGHDHTYERFPAMNADGAVVAKSGIPSIIAGLGGKSRYPLMGQRKNSLTVRNDRDGVLVMRLRNNGWTSAFLSTDNEVIDLTEGRCR
jgi:3',5'-cyclic AMP phosphodiesterase CpdA